jgi:hypothetical protein
MPVPPNVLYKEGGSRATPAVVRMLGQVTCSQCVSGQEVE